MISQSWVIILSVSFFITTMCFLVAIIFILFAYIEIRKASGALREFLKTTDLKSMDTEINEEIIYSDPRCLKLEDGSCQLQLKKSKPLNL